MSTTVGAGLGWNQEPRIQSRPLVHLRHPLCGQQGPKPLSPHLLPPRVHSNRRWIGSRNETQATFTWYASDPGRGSAGCPTVPSPRCNTFSIHIYSFSTYLGPHCFMKLFHLMWYLSSNIIFFFFNIFIMNAPYLVCWIVVSFFFFWYGPQVL